MPQPLLTINDEQDREGERALIEAAKEDRGAFGVLYRQHYPAVVGYLYRRTGDAHAAEDLAADTFLAAFRAIKRYRHTGAPLRMWLLRIATNGANRWAKQRGRLKLHASDAHTVEAAGAGGAPGTPGLEEAQAALLTLPPDQQAVISLHYLESLSLEEVAAVLGCRVGTVKSRLFRAREAMRAELKRRSTSHG
jgi:RNA polymerase sigma-70 factor (ECF subfamily)